MNNKIVTIFYTFVNIGQKMCRQSGKLDVVELLINVISSPNLQPPATHSLLFLNPINPVMRLGVFPVGGYIGGNGNHFGINSSNV